MYKSADPSSRQPFVVAIGGANMDISAVTRTLLAAHDSMPGKIQCAAGGVARNVAENLARLGVDVRLITVVGDDVFGQRLREDTASAGVNVDAMYTLAGRRSASYLSLQGPGGDMAVAVNDMAILDGLTAALVAPYAGWLEQAACIVLDCNLTAELLDWLTARFNAVPIFADGVSVVKCTRLVPLLGRIHTLKVNLHEARALCGLTEGANDLAGQCALHLHAMGVRQVVVSLGHEGICWSDARGVVGRQAASAGLEIVSTTGAGDALLAGLVQAQILGSPWSSGVESAMACAELTLGCRAASSAALSTQALQARLAEKMGARSG